MKCTTNVVSAWEKDGIPSSEIWTILKRIIPGKKRLLMDLGHANNSMLATIRSEREMCYQLMSLSRAAMQGAAITADLLSQLIRAAIKGIEIATATITKLDEVTEVLDEGKRQLIHVRSISRADAERCLARLRQKYIKEKPATTAHRTAHLLTMWDPDTKWKRSSIRVRLYDKQ